MLDDWQINWELRDLPPEVWDFLKAQQILRHDHSEEVRRARLFRLRAFGSHPQALDPLDLRRGHRHGAELARPGRTAACSSAPRRSRTTGCRGSPTAREIPCFGLTSPEAGSDAASMIDSGVVCRGTWQGREVLGIRLNWHKRYITLGADRDRARARLQALRSRSPDRRRATTSASRVALVPTNLPGVEIGRRHLPALQAFQNGPNSRPRRLHPDRPRHRRRRAGRQGLEDADERARGRARHLAAVAVGGGRRLRRAHHRRLCAHPRAIPSCRSAASRRSRSGSAAWPRPPICSMPRGASPAPASITATSPRWSPPS